MERKYLKLIRVLYETRSPMTAEQLADKLGISVRSVKYFVRDINRIKSAAILSSRSGYTVDTAVCEELLKNCETAVPQSNERLAYILSRLLHSPQPVDIYDLCDNLYISLSALRLELNKVKQKLVRFDLRLVGRQGLLTIEGLEKDKRKLLSALLYQQSDANIVNLKLVQNAFPDVDIAFIKSAVHLAFDSGHYFINDYAATNLILHIAIAIDRIRHNYINNRGTELMPQIKNRGIELARKITKMLETRFNIDFSENEIYELALLIASRATSVDYNTANKTNLVEYIGSEVVDLATELINNVDEQYFIKLNKDDFFVRFALHIHSLLIRSESDYFSKNPLKDEIKKSFPLIYDVSVFIASLIKQRTGITINDDEIAYIGFHIGSAIEEQKSFNTKVAAVLLSPGYYDYNHRIIDFINQHMSGDIFIIDMLADESELDRLSALELVITTIPISGVIKTPFVQIGPFPNESDLCAIRRRLEQIKVLKKKNDFEMNLKSLIVPELFEITDGTFNEVDTIKRMVRNLIALQYVESDFESQVFERENMSSTAYNLFAIPHSMQMNANMTGLSVLISKQPIDWNGKPVQLVVMLCFNASERRIFNEIYDPLTMILYESANIRRLIQCADYEEFIGTLVSMYS